LADEGVPIEDAAPGEDDIAEGDTKVAGEVIVTAAGLGLY
jgi:hypothetical protein